MSAEPIPQMPAPWQPDPMRQRLADHTLEDILNLPPDAPRVELVDGVMTVVPSPTADHQDIVGLLWSWLRSHAPKQFKPLMAVGVAMSERNTREPDVILLDDLPRGNATDGRRHFFLPERVVLAVEVVSESTRRTDRLLKPVEYAAAGIPHYWRVEQNPVHIYAYRIGDVPGPGGNRLYELVADSAELLELDQPFDIKLPIAEITP